MVWLIVVSWLICGVLAYGLEKNYWRQFFQKLTYVGYDWGSEKFCLAVVIFGPLGLPLSIGWILSGGYKLGFCWRMPKELCDPRHPI